MIEVKEIFGETAEKLCGKFALEKREDERVFALYDGEKSGVGLTRFECGAVRIRAYKTDGDYLCEELLLRTLLLDAARMTGYNTVVEQEGDYSVYGFEKSEDGQWTAKSENIKFPHGCKEK